MPVIEVTNLHKRYGDRIAVRDVTFRVERGEIFGILGPNGAGKTTTVECVAGLRVPNGGRVSVLGLDPCGDAARLRHRVGVQLQASQLPDRIRVREAVDLYASFYRTPVDQGWLLAGLGLTEQRDTSYRSLSGGQKQRLSIALALVGNPEIVILDELTTGLDPQGRRDTWELVEQVRNQGTTVLLVTHLMTEAERLCDRIAVFDAGRVVALDTPDNLIERVAPEQRLRFRPDRELDEQLLFDLPEVATVRRVGEQIVVTGTGNLLHAVTSVLARSRIIVADLRLDQPTLDEAVLRLIGPTGPGRNGGWHTEQGSVQSRQPAGPEVDR